ncbi:hypothetical protein TNCV_1892431 [Trichonephila clavipes]|nr:hypothetical protein TNCV_1892431 [Trichonephila clavipes]
MYRINSYNNKTYGIEDADWSLNPTETFGSRDGPPTNPATAKRARARKKIPPTHRREPTTKAPPLDRGTRGVGVPTKNSPTEPTGMKGQRPA